MSRRKPASSSRNLNTRQDSPTKRKTRSRNPQSSEVARESSRSESRSAPRRVSPRAVRLTLFIVFVLSSFTVGGEWLAHTSFLRVQHASVVGAIHEDAGKVLGKSGLLAHPTMLGLTDHAVLANLGQFAWVTGVQVQRQWPNTVVLRVYETHAIAVAYDSAHQLQYVGAEGQKLGPAPQNANLPTLSMAVSTRKWPFSRIGLGAVAVAGAIPASFGNQVSRITEQANGIVKVELSTPVTFILGPAVDLEKKFVAMASVISNYTLSPGETIDVTVPGEIAVTPAKG